MNILKPLLLMLGFILAISFGITYLFNMTIWKYFFELDFFLVFIVLLILDFSVIMKEVQENVDNF